MVCFYFAVVFGAVSTVTARYTPRSPDQHLVYIHDLVSRDVSYPTLEQDSSGSIPYFAYEENFLSATEPLPRLFQHANNLTTGLVNYTLEGPGNCKVFPGDANWSTSSVWLESSLRLILLAIRASVLLSRTLVMTLPADLAALARSACGLTMSRTLRSFLRTKMMSTPGLRLKPVSVYKGSSFMLLPTNLA